MGSDSEIEFSLPVELLMDVTTEKFVVADIINHKATSSIVRALSDKYPLIGYPHLKRVRSVTVDGGKRLQVLLLRLSDLEDTDLSVFLNKLVESCGLCAEDLSESPSLCLVPSAQPMTRQQYENAVNLWPTFFHENKELELQLKGGKLSEKDKEYIGIANRLSQKADGDIKHGAVIVNITDDVVVGVGYTMTSSHPLKHAVMMALDSVAISQGGGVWSPPDDDLHRCAMALLHSRIAHVFYERTSPNGALGTMYCLHYDKRLNHNFIVTRRKHQSDL